MKYSKQRNLVLGILRNTDTHPSAKMVYQEAKKIMPDIGIATIYRNLNALVESGEIQRITTSGDEDRYDGNAADHWHLECVRCGRVIDLNPKSEKAQQMLQDQICDTFGLRDTNVRVGKILLSGCCNDCLSEEKNRKQN